MGSHELVQLFLGLALLLMVARLGGHLARRGGFPSVVGELLAGIVLGPSLLGALLPDLQTALLPVKGNGAIFLTGFKNLACVLFMLAAGLEVNLEMARRQGPRALWISTAGMLFPFLLGLAAAGSAAPLLGFEGHTPPWLFALFFATAMSITALPVTVKTIMDLGLQTTEVGTVVVAAAMCDDLMGWLAFGLVLQLAGGSGTEFSIQTMLALTVLFGIAVLGPLRRLLAGRNVSASTVAVLGLLGAAYTEWSGIHALFGGFLIGTALATAVSPQVRAALETFVQSFFAPIFFAMVGLSVNFLQDFDLGLVSLVLLVACLGKVLGCWAAARASGMSRRDSWAVGLGMNGRGAMEIVMGSVAFQQGLIGGRLFVALVVMAAFTSALAGVALARLYPEPRYPAGA